MLKYVNFFKYALISEICIYVHYTIFPTYFLLNKSSTFLTPIELHTLSKNMKMHTNPDFSYKQIY